MADGFGWAAAYDEMVTGAGAVRPHWQAVLGALGPFEADQMAERRSEAHLLLRRNGVTYNVYGDPQGIERLWPLELLPAVIPSEDWAVIEPAVIQRARLHDRLVRDLYGPCTVVTDGLVPARAVFGNPRYLLGLVGRPSPPAPPVQLLAVDLVRLGDGRWQVLAERTDTPSGLGYALENRAVIGQVLADAVRRCAVRPIAPFLTAWRAALETLSPAGPARPARVALLTPGPYHEAYFEHAFLARQLNMALAEGEDLAVRDRRVFIKTLSGLEPVDVIVRRLADRRCDPLYLMTDSTLGVPGLVAAARLGTVAIANALGSAVLESMALRPYFDRLAERLLGEPLALADVPAWWCGDPDGLAHVLAHLDEMVIKPAWPGRTAAGTGAPVFAAELDGAARDALVARLTARPADHVGQLRVVPSTTPVWQGGLEPRPMVLRVFVATGPDGRTVMPGGLTRAATARSGLVVSVQRGGLGKDTWVLPDPAGAGAIEPRPLARRPVTGGRTVLKPQERRPDLPSRVADSLFWIGRYAERTEGLARLVRAICVRLGEDHRAGRAEELSALFRLAGWFGLIPIDLAETAAREGFSPSHSAALAAAVIGADHPLGIAANIGRLFRAAHAVRDRLSSDMWHVVDQIDRLGRLNPGRTDPVALRLRLDDLIVGLTALSGMRHESMTRGLGWRVLDLGQRLERAIHLVELLRGLGLAALPGDGGGAEPAGDRRVVAVLECLLELGESTMTYRRRHLTRVARAPVLGLLLLDSGNPRALAYQIAAIEHQLSALAEVVGDAAGADPPTGLGLDLVGAWAHALRQAGDWESSDALAGLLDTLSAELPMLSDRLNHALFSHAFARAS